VEREDRVALRWVEAAVADSAMCRCNTNSKGTNNNRSTTNEDVVPEEAACVVAVE
jgi:hypothetical protein